MNPDTHLYQLMTTCGRPAASAAKTSVDAGDEQKRGDEAMKGKDNLGLCPACSRLNLRDEGNQLRCGHCGYFFNHPDRPRDIVAAVAIVFGCLGLACLIAAGLLAIAGVM